jgi:hypothetical protein
MQASLRTVVISFVIPDGWSRQNKLWEKSPHLHATINLGWSGSNGDWKT